MAPTTFTDMGMAFEMLGFDVDMLPYGQAFGAADLADADLVVALPVVDYPSPDGGVDMYIPRGAKRRWRPWSVCRPGWFAGADQQPPPPQVWQYGQDLNEDWPI